MVGGCYRSPNCNKGEFLLEFVGWLDEIFEKVGCDERVIAGDFIIDCLKIRDKHVKQLKRITKDFGLKQLVKEANRVTLDSTSKIDLVFSDARNLECMVLKTPRVSDHDIVYVEGSMDILPNKILLKSKVNVMKMKEELCERLNRKSEESFEEKFINFSKDMLECISCTTGKDRYVKRKPYPWFNDKVHRAKDNRDLAYDKFALLKDMIGENHWEVREAWEKYKRYRNDYVQVVLRREKKNYYEENLWNNQSDPQKIWKLLKDLYSKKESKNNFEMFGQVLENPDVVAKKIKLMSIL